MNRRSLFAALCAPFVARFAQRPPGRRLSAANSAKIAELLNTARLALAEIPWLRAQINRELDDCKATLQD